jgi:hypothetical protein
MDTNYRKDWDDAIRAFNNQFPNDSKYNAPSYEKRSHLYRPKIRTVIRKNEAAAAAAFFSNMDVVDITPTDQDNKQEVASASGMKSLMQYRLRKTIPWYHIVLGGIQDAQVTGVVCAHIYWKYKAGEEEVEQEDAAAPEVNAEEEEYPAQSGAPRGSYIAEMKETSDESRPMLLMSGQDNQGAATQPILSAPLAQITGERSNQPPEQPEKVGEVDKSAEKPEKPEDEQEIVLLADSKGGVKKEPKADIDEPCVELVECENLRIHPAANWVDPINTSPYVIHIIPMYSMDVKEKMESGEWLQLGDGLLRQATNSQSDSTADTRRAGRSDPTVTDDQPIEDYEIVWVQRHIHRHEGEDWTFYTLKDVGMLTKPRKLSEVIFHLRPGERPYVMGCCILEAHKIYPTGVAQISKGLADESNEIVNQRIDNVKFVLNKKWFVKRGVDADISGLTRNVPGGVVMLENPQEDVHEVTWPDVTQSAYEEQQRIDNDFNELIGNFSPAQMLADRQLHAPARNMNMLAQSSGTLVEYLLRTFVETFVQRVLGQLVRMEQMYETDEKILSIAAKDARLFQRYGVNELSDEMLTHEMTLTVNVGMGATDPQTKLQKFLAALSSFTAMLQKPIPGINMQEVGKEIFGHLGYQDGARFFTSENPQLELLEQQKQQLMQIIQQLEQKVKDKQMGHQVSIIKNRESIQGKLTAQQIHETHEDQRNRATHWRALVESQNKHNLEAENFRRAHMNKARELEIKQKEMQMRSVRKEKAATE